MRWGWIVVAPLVAVAPEAAHAQPGVIAQAEHERIVRRLESDFLATIARERRMADDREARRIDELQAQVRRVEIELRGARSRGAVAQSEVRRLSASLEALEQEYATLTATIAARDVQTSARALSFREGILDVLSRAPRELSDAIRRFAEGDRRGAWPAIEAAARAGDVRLLRDAINLRATMVGFGEATAQDVRVLVDLLAEREPDDFFVQQQRQMLIAGSEGLASQPAYEATLRMTRAARTNMERLWAYGALGEIEMQSGRTAAAETAFLTALTALRAAAGVEAPPDTLLQQESLLLTYLSNLRGAQQDLAASDRYADELTTRLRAFAAQQPDSVSVRDLLGNHLISRGNLLSMRQLNDDAEQMFAEALRLGEMSLAAEPGNKARAVTLAQQHMFMCNWRLNRNGALPMPHAESANQRANRLAAVEACERAIALLRQMPDQTDLDRSALAFNIAILADVRGIGGDMTAARREYDQAIAMTDDILSRAPRDPGLLRQRVLFLQAKAFRLGTSADWSEVIAGWEALGRATPLQPADVQARDFAADQRTFAEGIESIGTAQPDPALLRSRQEAVDALRAALRTSPNNVELLRAYANAVHTLAGTLGAAPGTTAEAVEAWAALERVTTLSPIERGMRDLVVATDRMMRGLPSRP